MSYGELAKELAGREQFELAQNPYFTGGQNLQKVGAQAYNPQGGFWENFLIQAGTGLAGGFMQGYGRGQAEQKANQYNAAARKLFELQGSDRETYLEDRPELARVAAIQDAADAANRAKLANLKQELMAKGAQKKIDKQMEADLDLINKPRLEAAVLSAKMPDQIRLEQAKQATSFGLHNSHNVRKEKGDIIKEMRTSQQAEDLFEGRSRLAAMQAVRDDYDNPFSDKVLIDNFAKIQDLKGALQARETEGVEAAIPYIEQVTGKVKRALTAQGMLSPEMRRKMINVVEKTVATRAINYRDVVEQAASPYQGHPEMTPEKISSIPWDDVTKYIRKIESQHLDIRDMTPEERAAEKARLQAKIQKNSVPTP